MNGELDKIAKEFKNQPATIYRENINLYQRNIGIESSKFLRMVEQGCKKNKSPAIVLIAISLSPVEKKSKGEN